MYEVVAYVPDIVQFYACFPQMSPYINGDFPSSKSAFDCGFTRIKILIEPRFTTCLKYPG